MRGKYSPTVSAAYQVDQEWWRNYCKSGTEEYPQYDPEGYDSYGYDKDDRDRAGNYEYEYYADNHGDCNFKYNDALGEWRFDGVKPVSSPANTKIQELIKKAGWIYVGNSRVPNMEKFAELIVRECGEVATTFAMRWCREGEMPDYGYERVIKEHFGVE